MTQREQLLDGMEAIGAAKFNSISRKYIVFDLPYPSGALHVYLGKAGAVRIGRTVATSVPSPSIKRSLLLSAKDPEYASRWVLNMQKKGVTK